MCYIDLEPCEVWQEHRYRAAKEHRCDTCGRVIRRGLRYMQVFFVFKGQADTGRSCLPCWRDNSTFAAAHDEMRCTPGSLVDMICECIDENAEGVGQWKRLLKRIQARRPDPTPPAPAREEGRG